MSWKPGADIQDGRSGHQVGEEQKNIHRMERREQSQGRHGAAGGFSGIVLPRCLSVKSGGE